MKNEFTINKKEMLSWARKYYFIGVANILLFIICVFLGVTGLFLLSVLISNGGEVISWCIAIASIVIPVYKLFFERFVFTMRRYSVLSKTYGVSEWHRIFEFTDDDIILTDYNSVSRYSYGNIKRILEENDVVLLILNHNIALRFYKHTFTEGTWEECKAKIESKMQ